MATPCTIVTSGGVPVSEAAHGVPFSPTNNSSPVTIVTSGGLPVTFVGIDGVLWPGGVAPGGGAASFLLLADGTSFLLLADGTSKLQLAS